MRLSIPCVAGPYTDVAVTLTLTGSKLRLQPKLADANLLSVPPQRTVSIATSTVQNDAGVFEFSFRDERYMPFEEAKPNGAPTPPLPLATRTASLLLRLAT